MSDPFVLLQSHLSEEPSWMAVRKVRLLLSEYQGRFSILRDLKGIAARGLARWRTPLGPLTDPKPLVRATFDASGSDRYSFVTFEDGHLQPSIAGPRWVDVAAWWIPELNSYVQQSSSEINHLVASVPTKKVPVYRVATVVVHWHRGEPEVQAWVLSRAGFPSAQARLMAASPGDFDFTIRETQVTFGFEFFPKREVTLLDSSLLPQWLDENPEKVSALQGEVTNAWDQLPGLVAKKYSIKELCDAYEVAGFPIPPPLEKVA